MSDILLDTPPSQAASAAYSPEQANSIFTDGSTPKERVKAPEPSRTQQAATETAKPETNVQLESAGKKKGPMDKLGIIQKPKEEEKPAVDLKNGQVKPPTKEENLAILRERAEKAERELGEIKPEYEKIKPAYETTSTELAALKAKGLNEDERKEFMQLREMNAVEAVKRSRDFQEKILAPIKQRVNRIQSVAVNAKLNPQQTSALMDAVDIEDEFQRDDAIRAIIRGTGADNDLPDEKYLALANAAVATANDLNDNWYPKHDEALSKAEEVQVAARARQGQQHQEMNQRQQADMKKAHEEVYTTLSNESLKPLFEDKELSVDGTTLAEALKNPAKATTPQEMAAQEQLAAAAPFLILYANKALEKAAAIERANRVRNGAAPSRTDGSTKPQVVDGEKQLTADEVFKGAGMRGMG